MVTIALYDTLGPDACAYIINQSDYLYGYYSIVWHTWTRRMSLYQ